MSRKDNKMILKSLNILVGYPIQFGVPNTSIQIKLEKKIFFKLRDKN